MSVVQQTEETARIRDLEAALTQAIRVIEWCGHNDKTPTYNYGEQNRHGEFPSTGARFNTPREFADWWPERLRVALDTGRSAPSEEVEAQGRVSL